MQQQKNNSICKARDALLHPGPFHFLLFQARQTVSARLAPWAKASTRAMIILLRKRWSE